MRAMAMSICSRFAGDCRGSVVFLFGFAVMALGVSVGLAIDSARIYSVDKRVQAALDAAALAGAKLLSENPDFSHAVQSRAYAAFQANTTGISIGEATLSGFRATPESSTKTVNTSVDVYVPTIFGRLAGMTAITSIKSSGASYNQIFLEVVLALDVTGSMNRTPAGDTQTRMTAMKAAANQLVNGLYDSATSDSNVRISVVPWSSGVNAGAYLSVTTGSGSGGDCVVERSGAGATDDSLPSGSTYAQQMDPASGYTCPTQPVMALRSRSNRSSVTGLIDSLSPAGATAGHIGAAWGWYMISPTWASIHPSGSKPEPASSSVVKAAIIMTDGEFNVSFVGGSSPTDTDGWNEASYQMFQTICDGMRQQGIRVYTVAFDLDNAAAIEKLQACADSGNALTAANAAQLQLAFNSIMADLNSIKLAR